MEAEEIALDRGLRFAKPVRLARYEHAVHSLSEDVDVRDVPEALPTTLLAYRDADHEVRFLKLTPLAAAILERLLAREALGRAIQGACAELGVALDASVTASTATLVEDLFARGAVLGGQAC